AGGETSGSVMQALGHKQYNVGISIAPGVPVIQPTDNPELLLTLKSGNFGGPDFFLKACELMNAE
ncbi:MAG: nucleotide-binding domain containing protein, partial [Methyloligellaceae bacterium]